MPQARPPSYSQMPDARCLTPDHRGVKSRRGRCLQLAGGRDERRFTSGWGLGGQAARVGKQVERMAMRG